MKAIKFIFVCALVFAHYAGFAQETNNQDTTIYEYYVDDGSKEEKPAKEAQVASKNKSSVMDKIFFGGGLGASFGNYTYVNVSPIIGYRLTEKLSTGLRLMYQYTTFEYYVQNNDKERYKGHDLGIGIFARHMIYGPVFLQAEYEYLNYDGLNYDGTTQRENFDSFMAGGGFAQPLGRNAAIFITALYNFSYDGFNQTNAYRTPYNSPWVIRVGGAIGF